MTISKQQFFNSINKDAIANEAFFKKIYGYSIYDNELLIEVANKLINIGRKDILHDYNKWFKEWKQKDEIMRKNIGNWYGQQIKVENERTVKESNARTKSGRKPRYRFTGFPQDW